MSSWRDLWGLTHEGSWGTPELGLTELISDIRGIPRDTTTGGSSNTAAVGNTTPFTNNYVSTQYPTNAYANNLTGQATNPGQILGLADTSNNDLLDGQPQQQIPNGSGDSGQGNDQQLAVMKWLADLENAKRQAASYRESGRNTFNDLLAGIDAFRKRTGEQFENAGQEITNIFGDITGQNARLGQSARTQAIQQARRGGYGDSSRLGLLNQVTGNLAGMQGAATARRGENQAQNLALRGQRDDEAQGQENQANTYLKGVNESAGELERLGQQNAGFDFGGMLNNIINYNRQLGSMQAPNTAGLAQYSPNFSGLTNTLNGVTNNLSGGLSSDSQNMAANLANPTTYQELLKRRGLVQ